MLFRSLDGFYVSRALEVLTRSILPHTEQTLGQFETRSADQRARVTADSALAPYDLFYDYGAMECALPPDPLLRPVLLLGPATGMIGRGLGQYPRRWRERGVGDSLHGILEAMDACTGLR